MPHHETYRALLTMAAYSIIGNTVLAVQPMVVGGLVDLLHFSERQAGFIASAELAGFSVAGLAVLTFVHRANRRVLALAGVALLVCSDIAACLISSYPAMLICRSVAGMGSAAAYSIFPVLAAASSRPERVFGVVNATSIAYAGAFVWLAPRLLALWHLPGIFLGMALLAVILCPTILWTPARRHQVVAPGLQAAPSRSARSRLNMNIAILLGVTLCLYIGHGGIWAYQERIGMAAGLRRVQVGALLGSSMLIWGVAGSMLATWLGLVIGRIWPQVLSFAISIVAAVLLVVGGSPAIYGVACALIALSWFYGLPYLSGWLALLDPNGRANIACMLVSTTGSALGPGFAAALVGSGSGYASIAAMAGTCYLICLGLVLLNAAYLARSTPSAVGA
jgi:predicted MFS family arabinose efflux permease